MAYVAKIAGESGAVIRNASKEGETGGDREVTPPYIGSGVTPNDGGDQCFTLPYDGIPSRST